MQGEKGQHRGPGLAAVVNGKIKVIDPSPGEPPATIIPAEGIIAKVNGNQIFEETEVTENDIIEIEPEIRVTPAELKISVSENKMEAYLEINPEIKITYVLKEQPPAKNLRLLTEKQVFKTVPYTFDDIMAEIKKQGIVKADEEALRNSLESAGYRRVKIASGTPPTPPRDEKVELKFSTEKDSRPVMKANGRVDFRESAGSIISVEPGNIIAEKIPGAPGRPGTDVYGKKVEPREPQKVFLQAGSGTRLDESGTKVIAVIAGQPEIKMSGSTYHFSVQPNFVHKGNVDLNSGNIRFKGNIQIKGNVEQGMLVSGTGEVQVDGLVSNATIVSGGDLTLNKHVLASRVEAGAAISTINVLLPLLENLQQSLADLRIAVEQIITKLQGKAPLGKVVALLLDKKFPSIPRVIKQILNTVEKDSKFPREVEQMSVDLRKKLWGINILQLRGIEDIKDIMDKLDSTSSYLKILLDSRANAYLQYSLNSSIEATGNVFVMGQGCIDTRIKAGGSVYVSGIFRGGSIEAGDNVTLGEAGSKVGTPTFIKVPGDKSIFIGKAYENVTLKLGEQQFTLKEITSNIQVKLDVYDVVEFSPWKPPKGDPVRNKIKR